MKGVVIMKSNSKLEELKRQVKDTSNKQIQIQGQRDRAKEIISYREQEQEQNQKEMVQLVRNVFGQSELASAKERELLQDKLDKFSHRQSVMNEQLITLNDNLMDITALKSVYDAKREELELDYQNQKEALLGQINSLTERLESRKNDLKAIENDIGIKTSKLEEIVAETKKASFWNQFKKTWIDKRLVYVIIGVIAAMIGGVTGWSIFTLMGKIFSAIWGFLTSPFI